MSKKRFHIFGKKEETKLQNNDAIDFSKEIAEHMQDLVAVSNKDGQIIYASPSHKHLGYTPKELIGKNILDFVHKKDYSTSDKSFNDFINGDYQSITRFRFLHADGTYVWHETIARKIKNGHILYCSRDISKRRIAEEKLNQKQKENVVLKNTQRAMIDNNKDITVIIDSEKNVKFISANIEVLFGWKDSEIINRDICHLIPIDMQSACREKIELCTKANDKFVFEGELIRKDGTICDVELSCKNFLNKQPITGILINISDITERKQAERKIYESNERYKALHDASFGGIALHDKGIIIDCNLGLEELSGYSRSELLGMDGLLLIADEYRDTVRANINAGYKESYEVMGVHKNGKQYNLRLHGRNIPYKGKEMRVVEFRDITEQKQTEQNLIEQQRLFTTMFNTIKEAIVITDKEGNIIMANDSIETTFGYKPEHLINRSFKNLFPNDDQYSKVIHEDTEGKTNYTNITYQHLDGHTFEGEIFNTKLYDNSNQWIGNIAVNRDITETIKALNDIQEAKDKAEESSRLKTEFINNMSHEIRTPMNAIIGFSEMLANTNNLSEDRQKYFINIILNSSEQLLRIIDDILEISILETNKLKINESEICLNTLLDTLYAEYESISNNKKVPLRITKSLNNEASCISSDETKLKKTINNLLSNAIKYTNEGYIEIGYKQQQDSIAIYVKDTGSGIAPENHKLIFERFAQAEKEVSQKRGGLGLGLSIAQANAQLLGGDITVQSAIDQGATFTITLPYKNNTVEQQDGGGKAQALHSDKFTILIAEDEDVNYLYLEAVIDAEYKDKYIIHHAHDGEEAVNIALNRDDIDLILMDIKMPNMNGLEATQHIKAQKPNLIIIAQTAYTTEQDINQAKEYGCDDFISKPINRNDLIQMINKYIDINK